MNKQNLPLGKLFFRASLISFVFIGLAGGAGFAIWQTNQMPSAEQTRQERFSQAQVKPPTSSPVSTEEAQASESNPAIQPAPLACTDRPIRIKAVGDIMLSRTVGTISRRRGDPAHPFRETAEYLREADISFGNLESPFSDQGPMVGDSGMVFKAEPEMVEGLNYAGIDLVSLANNHFGDQGRHGMAFTFAHLEEHGIQYFGAGRNKEAAHAIKIIQIENCRIGFLGYNDVPPQSYQAGEDTPGHAWADQEQIVEDVANALKKTDFLILSFHWGVEYTPTPSQHQRVLARAAIGAGADMIVSHHPHVVQEVEYIDDKLVIYSLGNFVFDQMWSVETQQGVIADFVLNLPEASSDSPHSNQASRLSLEEIDFIPVRIHNYNQPRFITDQAESAAIFERMGLSIE